MLFPRMISTIPALRAILFVLLTYLIPLSHGRALHKRQLITTPSIPNGHWIDTWAAMPQLTESSNLPPAPYVSFYTGGLRMGRLNGTLAHRDPMGERRHTE